MVLLSLKLDFKNHLDLKCIQAFKLFADMKNRHKAKIKCLKKNNNKKNKNKNIF